MSASNQRLIAACSVPLSPCNMPHPAQDGGGRFARWMGSGTAWCGQLSRWKRSVARRRVLPVILLIRWPSVPRRKVLRGLSRP